eukprot:m.53371 g.53371  ORF g.53371 m.53371 type:complete len:1267 (+) comp6761_c0_seq2:127-3927(+)
MFRFAIDRGGTFTDVYAECPDGTSRALKLLSEDPAYPDAPREGIRRVLEQVLQREMPRSGPVDASHIESIRMGTTVATNALLERKGERFALVITRGLRDLLHIGNQSRPRIFDLKIQAPDVLYDAVVEAPERILLDADGPLTGSTGERFRIEQPLDEAMLCADLKNIHDQGICSLAVVLMHAYLFPDHERRVRELAREIGFSHITLSSETSPMVKIVPRGFTSAADAYLTPCIDKYLRGFTAGFANLDRNSVLFMQSDGGLTPMEKFNGARAILSGPAGGVVGYAMTAFSEKTRQPVIGFDMGGTSTDVSRYAGAYEHVFETTTAGVTIQAPQLDINTVAAGGGSRLFFRAGMFVVGPESAGAHPGPVCYRKGGPLTVTDANLLLGRISPAHFPHIFGKNEDQPLDLAGTTAAFEALTAEINQFKAEHSPNDPAMSPQEVALGFLRVANEAMCRPIRALTQAKGFNTAEHVLASFGGAGGQHACAIARSLGMSRIFIHRHSGILSAFGLALADVVHESQEPCAAELAPGASELINARFRLLASKSVAALRAQGFADEHITIERFLHLRYRGTDCAIMTPLAEGSISCSNTAPVQAEDFQEQFEAHYKREFGFALQGRPILIDDIRIRATGHSKRLSSTNDHKPAGSSFSALSTQQVFFEDVGALPTPFFRLEDVPIQGKISGPAVLLEANSTVLLEPDCEASISADGDLVIKIGDGTPKRVTTDLDMVHLSVFSHRFMSIAEQMGRALQRTSISTNIKERLDFSCALFGPDGGLVANAPHIPVHLGAMQEAVRYQIEVVGDRLEPGDVLVSNHPAAGGSHLPDITVMTPVFTPETGNQPIFWVASRGHHADIGGITPGSMPPRSVSLLQEGAAIKSFFLVRKGEFQEDGITELLMAPKEYPGCSGTRNLADNLSDLRAQIAANQRGIVLVGELIQEFGLDVVQAYMQHIQDNAEFAVRAMLKETAERLGRNGQHSGVMEATDYLDDGSPIHLKVSIDANTGSAHFDFEGTGCEVHGNCNAPRAITYSAVIYCMRCMVGHDVPLNQGCLKPVSVTIPKGSLLWPSDEAAVVGGNVLTSQRVVDVILRAFGACAASQGCMNNVTFGNAKVGYYETVAGGAGAGPTWPGRHGVHTHMTNTRITDPEILERRYPVILERFMLRDGSGGRGRFAGGNGVIRELRFREPLTLSVLSERRAFQPYGLDGGEPGARGANFLFRDDRQINLGGKATIDVLPGDVFQLLTPGGGGYGEFEVAADEEVHHAKRARRS